MKRTIVSLIAALVLAAGLQAVNTPDWLRTAVFYQLYPSSYMDTDGDGIGDIPGIISKLDYIQSLGVNVVWLNPTFESAWEDGGYDVIDFYKTDPRFGTNDDMVRLIGEIHKRGMHICLDLVAGHSSDKNPWFLESASGTNMHYSDYYIWADDPNGGNGQALSEGAAMFGRGRWVESDYPRARFYQRNAGPFQPALNYGFANPDPNHPWEQSVDAPGPQAMRRELRNIMQFWFEKGVDGFRVDMAASLVKNDPGSRETIKLWQEVRAWMDAEWPECVLVSEWGNPPTAIEAGYNMDFMFHFGVPGYASLFFAPDTPFYTYGGRRNSYQACYFDKSGQGAIKDFVQNYKATIDAVKGRGYVSVPSSNHDYQRPNIGTRNTLDQLKVSMTFFLTLPGVPIIYYGDEIGMKFDPTLPDKEGSGNRSGARTPMQWTNGFNAGYSTCAPERLYLPEDTDGGLLTVETQEADPKSLLNLTRAILRLRAEHPALGNDAEWELVSPVDQPYPMVYKRTDGKETFLVALNPGAKAVKTIFPTLGAKSVELVIGEKAQSGYKSGKKTDQISMKGITSAIFKLDL